VPECIKATRYALRQGADFIKVFTTGGVLSERDLPNDIQFNMDEIKAIVETAAQVGKFVTAHCQNSRGAKNSIIGGIKTIDHANDISDEIIELALKHGTIFVSTLAIALEIVEHGAERGIPPWGVEKAKIEWGKIYKSISRIHKAGAPIAAGTDFVGSPMLPFGNNAVELELLVKYAGFSPMEAIVATTKHGAMACFIGDRTGTIEPGKMADIIVVDGDPLKDIRILQDKEKIKMVMLEGKIAADRSVAGRS
jgi:imidazolonepropionase-like amidohydrolase